MAQQYLIDAASAALGARRGTHAADPGPGYWNNRADFRTNQPAIGDSNATSVAAPHGIGYARSRAVPTGSCPSGPCGCREEIATWYVPHVPLQLSYGDGNWDVCSSAPADGFAGWVGEDPAILAWRSVEFQGSRAVAAGELSALRMGE